VTLEMSNVNVKTRPLRFHAPARAAGASVTFEPCADPRAIRPSRQFPCSWTGRGGLNNTELERSRQPEKVVAVLHDQFSC
jgi:hypothetical protein